MDPKPLPLFYLSRLTPRRRCAATGQQQQPGRGAAAAGISTGVEVIGVRAQKPLLHHAL